jgi:hypothetical protein
MTRVWHTAGTLRGQSAQTSTPILLSSRSATWHASIVTDETPWTEVFTSVFQAPSSAVEARIWAEVYGDEYPGELEPYSFTTRSELRRIVDGLALSPDDLMIDIGCGRGARASG